MDSERRQAPRYPFIAEAVVTEISSDTKLIAKTGDLSIGGCFLDMLNPTPQGTQVRVRISHDGATFTALGSVAFILPNMGMGQGSVLGRSHQLLYLPRAAPITPSDPVLFAIRNAV